MAFAISQRSPRRFHRGIGARDWCFAPRVASRCCISCCCDPCGFETNSARSIAPTDDGRWTAIPLEQHHQEWDYGRRPCEHS